MKTNPLMARFAGQEALVEPSQTARFESCLAEAIAHPRYGEMASIDGSADFWTEEGSWCRPYIVQNGILQIPVKGVLLNNFPYALGDWATGYEYIWEAFKRGCGDYVTGAVRGIALVEDTPGGMVAGCFDTVDKMIALRDQVGVPVAAFAHESAYSAGYAMALVADPGQIYVSRTGGVGSIGVVTSHMSVAGAMEKAGLVFTYISSDPSKVEGNPYQDLSPAAKARIQVRIDELYGIFVAAVARSRGLGESVIREDLKAYCYTATQAVSNGLADKIGSLEDATSAFAGFLDDLSDTQGEEAMTTPVTAVDQAAIDTAVATAIAAERAAAADAAATAVAADRERQKAITGHAEAEGRGALASHFALNTSMSVEDAVASLKAAPKESAATPNTTNTGFTAAMDNTPNPEVGANKDGDTTVDEARANGDDVLALIGNTGLRGFKTKN
ncbi:S49 family peptidase [Sphingomonas sp. TREG-RG-20F-R18-01]|uniref:S49 family peptidase n=1 Tax=Sphingomonas sp. TREG-RG-20F-R18-01 TaxID=2914982 RepID=UPI001F565051|nr:S49 family peptidase [Sphingomonas sp. TREG-RG-20F-R18-01]